MVRLITIEHEKNKKDMQPIIMPKRTLRSNIQRNNRLIKWHMQIIIESSSSRQINNPNNLFGDIGHKT